MHKHARAAQETRVIHGLSVIISEASDLPEQKGIMWAAGEADV